MRAESVLYSGSEHVLERMDFGGQCRGQAGRTGTVPPRLAFPHVLRITLRSLCLQATHATSCNVPPCLGPRFLITCAFPTPGTLLAVQFVHAVVNRIIPTSNGFMAPTSHGYLIRERFQCPSARASQQDPLRNFKKAVWLVKARQREELAAAEASQDAGPLDTEGKDSKSNKRSQVCLIL